jgi:hypothetical protein
MQTVPILPSVDPRGILDKLTQEGYLHGEDNQVDYYQVHKNGPKGSKM